MNNRNQSYEIFEDLLKAAETRKPKWPAWTEGTKLYHGTSMSGIVGILKDNAIDEGVYWEKPNEPHGVRFTTSKKVATTFAIEGLGGDEGAILELDGAALGKAYKLVSYQDQDALGNPWGQDEKEVVALAKKVSTKFITAIYLKNPFPKQSDAEDYAQLVEEEQRMPAAEWLARYAALMKNPLVRNPLIPKPSKTRA